MKKLLLSLAVLTLLNGCAVIQSTGLTETKPEVTKSMMVKEFDAIPPPAVGKPLSVAVYSFADKTGQRRPQANVASLSTAVTQGAEAFLIQALQGVGRGRWFDVVERVGIDNLTKERLIIRQMREAYEGPKAQPLMPMQFAGMILEGGIIGYDTTTTSGGAGMRIFGIGKQTQWSTDTVTVSLRAVSVNTGKVLAVVTVQKTILSTADSMTALKFFDNATQSFEAEAGLTINEPGTYAVKAAVELAVVELIKEGERKGVWEYRKLPVVATPTIAEPVAIVEAKPVVEKPVVVATADPKELAKNPNNPVAGVRGPPPQAGKLYLKETSFIYREKDEKSQKTWQFVTGTELTLVTRENEWIQVKDSQGRGGWVTQGVVQETPVEKSVPQVNKEVIKAEGQGKK
jgi:curli production assembly/transport component CsgG